MQPALRYLIQRFRKGQDRGVAFIVDVLGQTMGVRSPQRPSDWVRISVEAGLYNVRQVSGVGVYSHGYGIELIFRDLTIDFDWGEAGEPDGFDVWRLWNFARSNASCAPLPAQAQVRAWVEEAAAAGELSQDRYLYYSPDHRVAMGAGGH